MKQGRWPLLVILLGFGPSACSISSKDFRTVKLADQPVRHELSGAIGGDLQHDMLFNGTSWADLLRGSDAYEDLTVSIQDMRCRSSKRRRLCAFDLVRLGESKRPSDVEAPKGLHCTARFIHDDEGWAVVRLRPRNGVGHTRTSIECSKF